MRKIVLLLFLSFYTILLNAQFVFYGFPSDEIQLNDSDVIIINLPNNIDARFIPSNELNNLLNIIKNNPNLFFEIQINFALGSTEYNNSYSDLLAKNLEKYYLERNCNIRNFSVISFGENNPICIRDRSFQCKNYNTRMEIHIKHLK